MQGRMRRDPLVAQTVQLAEATGRDAGAIRLRKLGKGYKILSGSLAGQGAYSGPPDAPECGNRKNIAERLDVNVALI